MNSLNVKVNLTLDFIAEVRGFISLDADDLRPFSDAGELLYYGIGHADGKDMAKKAAERAISNPLMGTSLKEATDVLVHITGSLHIDLEDVEIAAGLVVDAAHKDANIIFGAAFDEDLEYVDIEEKDIKGEIRVIVIARKRENEQLKMPGVAV